jgi:lipoprotein NlpD
MPFLRPFSSKLAVVAAVGFVLSGCMTTSRIPAPVEHRDSQQAKGIVVDSEQVALDSTQPGQADYRLAETPQSGVRGQWPESRIAATDPNRPGVQAPLVGGNQPVMQANRSALEQNSAAPTIRRESIKSLPPARMSTQQQGSQQPIVQQPITQQPNSVAVAKAPTTREALAPKAIKTDRNKQPTIQAKQPDPKPTVAKQPAQKAPPKIAMANKPSEQKPVAKKSAEKTAPKSIASSDSKFIWPAHGALVQKFADKKSMGIGISGRAGDRVNATADGEVIFSGLGPRGYGKLLIVKHNPELLSVYAHNRNLLVKEGQEVRQGQKIAELGSTGTDRPKLHFEIRRQGKPVDPLAFLPERK